MIVELRCNYTPTGVQGKILCFSTILSLIRIHMIGCGQRPPEIIHHSSFIVNQFEAKLQISVYLILNQT